VELRAGYKQTQIGIIPKTWEAIALGEIGEPLIGLTYDPEDIRTDGTLVLRSSNIDDGTLRFDDIVCVSSAVPERIMVRKDDILICVRNGSRNLIGKCAILDERAQGMTFGAFMSVLRTPHARFVYHQLQSQVVRKQIDNHLGATINQITNSSLKSFVIPFPDTECERSTIATALSDVDALISSLDKLIAKKRDIKQAAMQQLLTGRRRLPGFSGRWEERRLEDVAALDSENLGGDTPRDYEFNYVSLEDVNRGILRGYANQLFSSAPSRARRVIRSGDVLVSTVRPNLGSHLLFKSSSPDWICSTGFSVVRCVEDAACPGYVFYHLFGDYVTRQIDAQLTGSSYPAISSKDVGNLRMPFPSIDEQRAIASVLSDMDAEIEALERRRDKTWLLKQGMMQELLTGRVRLV